MVDTPISKLLAAGTLIGDEPIIISQRSTSVVISAATISALASDQSFNDSGSGFLAAGFAIGDYVNIEGFTGDTANNIFSAEITDLDADKMTIGGSDGAVIVDDAAGETVTISKWVSKRQGLDGLVSGALTLIGSAVAAGGEASLSVGSIPTTFEHLMIMASVKCSANSNIHVRLNGDSGANYDFARQYGGFTQGGDLQNGQTSFDDMISASGTANIFNALDMKIFSYARTDRHKAVTSTAYITDTFANFYVFNIGGRWKSTAAVNSVSLTPFTGGATFSAGSRLDVYGLAA